MSQPTPDFLRSCFICTDTTYLVVYNKFTNQFLPLCQSCELAYDLGLMDGAHSDNILRFWPRETFTKLEPLAGSKHKLEE